MQTAQPVIFLALSRNRLSHIVRYMLRNCGARDVRFFTKASQIALPKDPNAQEKSILILDETFLSQSETKKLLHQTTFDKLNAIIILAAPTEADIIYATALGATDIITYPFSEQTLQRKVEKLVGSLQAPLDDFFENRKHERLDLPLLIGAPTLSNFAFVPEDVSLGGMRITVSGRPDMEKLHPIEICAPKKRLKDLYARIAWAKPNPAQAGSWTLGLELQLTGLQHEAYTDVLEKFMEVAEA